jgi:phosphoribosylformylglycinamidine cyclo-ligase
VGAIKGRKFQKKVIDMRGATYKKAGVDIDKAEAFIREIRPLIDQTTRDEVLGKIGGFGGLFKPRFSRLKDPVLVSSTDGVGTKILIADILGKYDTLGLDLVAMCADDVAVAGAEPLFFLDYIACGSLDRAKLYDLMKGMVRGCRKAGCSLIGGETAELPGIYAKDKFDIAGFCVGMVSRDKIIDGRDCREGDLLIGLASSGLHSNGFSLVRKLFSRQEIEGNLAKELIRPTRIYAKTILQVSKRIKVKAMSHITGGGLLDNIPRVLPKDLMAAIKKESWPRPSIFYRIQRRGLIEETEMFRTFNMGIGMVLILAPRSVSGAFSVLDKLGQKAWVIGELGRGKREVVLT